MSAARRHFRVQFYQGSITIGSHDMLGAIAGDIIGSVFEGKKAWMALRTPHFEPLFNDRAVFTDDTVLTVAVAESLLTGADLAGLFKDYFRRYPAAGYGGRFLEWAVSSDSAPYNSWGNGSAMRVSPVGWAFASLDEVLIRARWSAEVTHNHPDAVAGAQAVAAAVFLGRTGASKDDIRDTIERKFHYDLGRPLDDIRPDFRFDVSCRGTVPPALRAFLESDDYESAVRLAVSLGGDADTLAAIAGAVAEAYYGGVPEPIRDAALARLDGDLRAVVAAFENGEPL